MKIINMSVEDYLRKLGCIEDEIKVSKKQVYDSETLREYLNVLSRQYLWDYPECEILYLLKCEEDDNKYRECYKENTFAVIFNRLWEVEE